MHTIRVCLAAFIALVSFTVHASATVLTFSDMSSFLTASGATNATGGIPCCPILPGTSFSTLGAVTFSVGPPSSQWYMGAGIGGVTNADWTIRLSGPDIAISGIENLNMDFLGGPIFSVGFEFVEPELDPNLMGTFIDSTFTVTLSNGAAFVDSFTFNAPNDVASFIGVWGDVAFNRIEIRETTGGIENEFFGRVFRGVVPFVIPEPHESALLTLGLVSLAGSVSWKRRAKAHAEA